MDDPPSTAQLMTAIPRVLDYGVERIRAMREFKIIDADFRSSLERADKAIYLLRSHLIVSQLTPVTEEFESCIAKALMRTHHNMMKLNVVLEDRRIFLRLDDGKTSTSEEKSPSEKLKSPSCKGTSFANINGDCESHSRTTFRPLYLQLSRLRYMIRGTISIEEAVHELEMSNKHLAGFFPVNQFMTQLMSYNKDAVAFARTVKQRDNPCTRLSITLKRAPLEETDDPIFFKVTEEGEYNGCIIERRDTRSLRSWDGSEWAVKLKETDLLTKRLREDKQALDDATTTKVGLLRSCGYMVPHESAHDLIFRKPPGHTARTLRNLLCSSGSENHRIDDRLDFAIKLATAVHIFHSVGLVHKNIKPESILVMQPISSSNEHLYDLGAPYLADFNAAQYDENASGMYSYDKTMKKKLYLHPRQFINYWHQVHRMRDDVYSLGVCLLEVGLWRSAFRWDETKPKGKRYVVAEWAKDFFVDPPRVNDSVPRTDNGEYLVDVMRKQKLIRLAETLLPTKMNDIYCQAVVTCLTFEEDNDSAMEENSACVGSAKFFSDVICELRHAKGI